MIANYNNIRFFANLPGHCNTSLCLINPLFKLVI